MTDHKSESKTPWCPIKFKMLGPAPSKSLSVKGGMALTWRASDQPCDKVDCALWDPGMEICSFRNLNGLKAIDVMLSSVGDAVESLRKTHSSVLVETERNLCEEISATTAALRDLVEAKKQLLISLLPTSKNVSKDRKGE